MRVLLTADCVGGVWTYALDVARQLTRDGHAVMLAVMGAPLAPDQRAALDAAGVAHDDRPYKLEWMGEPEDDLRAAGAWLLDLAAAHGVDVAHLNQFSHAALPWPCPTIVVAHSDVVTWWRAVRGVDPDATWDAYRERVAAGLAAADLVVAPTAAMLEDLRGAYRFGTRTRVIHNGRAFTPAQAVKRPQIASVGRVWDEAKNLAVAARAAARMPWPLLLAGPGEVPGAQCLGRVGAEQVAALLAASRIFLAPARYEPFGLAALEAALSGCALVLGDITTQREVWGDAAVFVDPGDERGLQEVLAALIADPDVLAERASAAGDRAKMFSAAKMASAYADCYREVALASAGRDACAS